MASNDLMVGLEIGTSKICALVLLGGAAHAVDADRDHVTRAQVPHQLIEPGRADDVGKENGKLDVFSHAEIDQLLRGTPAFRRTAATAGQLYAVT